MGRSQDEEGGWTGSRAPAETWAEFDALPRGLKRFYWGAAYSYTAISAVRGVRRGLDLRGLAAVLRRRDAANVRREAARLYGPDHPQARA